LLEGKEMNGEDKERVFKTVNGIEERNKDKRET